jgi:hypothetical protein
MNYLYLQTLSLRLQYMVNLDFSRNLQTFKVYLSTSCTQYFLNMEIVDLLQEGIDFHYYILYQTS